MLYDSFTDGNFTAAPVWGGNTSLWTIVANSDAAAGATGSSTLRLNAAATSTTDYLSSQINTWTTSQEWGVWFGRRAQAFTAANQQYFWLYANESTLNNATVDGYRLAIGDDAGNDEIRLEYIVNGAVNATVITSSGAITNGLTDIGFLVRVTRSSSGAWQIFTSTLPTANGTGAIATAVPDSTNATVSQGSATHNTLVPATNGYLGVAALHSTGGSAIIGAEFDQVYFTPAAAAVATKLAITNISPSSPIAGSGFNVTVQSQEPLGAANNVIANTDFTLTSNGNAGAITGTTTGTITAGSNSVVVTGVVLPSPGTAVNLTATRTAGDILTAGTSSNFNVISVPTKFAITNISPASPTAGTGFSVTIEAQDASNTPANVQASTGFSLSTNGNAGAISGTTTGSISAGSATVVIPGVMLATAGTNVTITATRTSGDTLTAGTSAAFTVQPSAVVPTKFAITNISPSSPTAGSGFDVTVQAQDAGGTPGPVVASTSFALTKSAGSGGGTIGGTTTGTITAGLTSVTVTGVTLSTSGTGITLTATQTSGDALTPGTSAPFNVLPSAGGATKLAITNISPASPYAGVGFDVTVQAQNSSNAATNVVDATDFSLSNTGGGTLGGTTTGTITAGTNQIVLSGVTLSTAGTGITLTATRTAGENLTAGTSASFTVQNPATKLAITNISPASPTVGVGFDVTVQSQDTGNVAANVLANTGFTLTNTGGGTIGGTTTGTIVAGTNSIVVSGVTLSSPGTGITLTATRDSGDSLTAGTSAPFNVNTPQPTIQASNVHFTSINANSMTVNWTSGNGSNRLVTVRVTGVAAFAPTDGTQLHGQSRVFKRFDDGCRQLCNLQRHRKFGDGNRSGRRCKFYVKHL